MINKSILNPNAHNLNSFTKALKFKCEVEGSSLVKMRNGTYIFVSYNPALKDDHDPRFECFDGNACFIWELDGTSITSHDFDLIEFEPIKK